MHGMICIHKPVGMTSHDVVARLRKIYQTKSVGHAGTLDPEASGLLICALNKGTRLLKFISELEKTYVFDVVFGQTTDTLDHVGRVLSEDPDFAPHQVTLDCASFVGDYEQTTPLYSAVKVAGRKLYDYARKGETPPFVPTRYLQIRTLIPLNDWFRIEGKWCHSFEVRASHGLYVRQLAADLAQSVGTLGHTARIERTAIGDFRLDCAPSLEDLTEKSILPIETMVSSLKTWHLNPDEARRVSHGQPLVLDDHTERLALWYEHQLLAVYENKEGIYKANVVLS